MKIVLLLAFALLVSGCIEPTGQLVLTKYKCPDGTESSSLTDCLKRTIDPCTPDWKCTDWSVCVNDIMTRSCSDMNSCGAGRPSESQHCGQLQWRDAAELSGESPGKTGSFSISGNRWRFAWSCQRSNAYDSVSILVYKDGKSYVVKSLYLQKCPMGEEMYMVSDGPGSFYFDVSASNVASWKIRVEDWK